MSSAWAEIRSHARPSRFTSPVPNESLARADRHVSHHTCGAQIWDGRCGTCARSNQREAMRLNEQETAA